MSAPSAARAPMPAIETTQGAKPMNRRASRLFVLACLLLMGGAAFGMAWYLTRSARDHQAQIGAPTDNRGAVPGFGVTNSGDGQ